MMDGKVMLFLFNALTWWKLALGTVASPTAGPTRSVEWNGCVRRVCTCAAVSPQVEERGGGGIEHVIPHKVGKGVFGFKRIEARHRRLHFLKLFLFQSVFFTASLWFPPSLQ